MQIKREANGKKFVFRITNQQRYGWIVEVTSIDEVPNGVWFGEIGSLREAKFQASLYAKNNAG